MSIFISGHTVNPKGIKAVVKDGLYYYGKYDFAYETELIIARAKKEGFTLPPLTNLIKIDNYIKALKQSGVWEKLDSYNEFIYNTDKNLFTFTNNYGNSVWPVVASPSAKEPNTLDTLDPIGGNTAVKFTDSSTGGLTFNRTVTIPSISGVSSYYTTSFYVKGGTGSASRPFRVQADGINLTTLNLNLTTGTYSGGGSEWTVTPVGNGWYYCVHVTPTPVSTSIRLYYGRTSSASPSTFGTWYMWGFRTEQGTKVSTPVDLTNFSRINWRQPFGTLATIPNPTGVSFNGYGFTGDGLTGYIDTGYQPGLITGFDDKFVQNSATIGGTAVVAPSASATQAVFGNNVATDYNRITLSSATTHRINSIASLSAATDMSGVGMKSMIRDSSTNIRMYNKAVRSDRTAASTAIVAAGNAFVLRRTTSYSTLTTGNIFWGGNLTEVEYLAMRTAYNNYLTTIGLQPIA